MMDARQLTDVLRGKWHARYGIAPCPVCQPEGRRDQAALTLADGARGLLLHCKKANCDFRAILAAAGIAPGGHTPPDRFVAVLREAERRRDKAMLATQARRLWDAALPVGGTLAEAYLRGRRITCPLPATLRFAPACWHASGTRLPAVVARVEGSAAFAIHRTYLRADGLGKDGAGKADVTPTKAMLGAVRGGAVRLAEGPGPLVVCEGIETGLSLASGLLRAPGAVWAALSASGLRGLRLAQAPGRLTVAQDGDEAGRSAALALAARAHALGWAVSLLEPPNGCDWNDVLQGKAAVA